MALLPKSNQVAWNRFTRYVCEPSFLASLLCGAVLSVLTSRSVSALTVEISLMTMFLSGVGTTSALLYTYSRFGPGLHKLAAGLLLFLSPLTAGFSSEASILQALSNSTCLMLILLFKRTDAIFAIYSVHSALLSFLG